MAVINDLTENLISGIDILNRLSNILSQYDNAINNEQIDSLNDVISTFNVNVGLTVRDLEDDYDMEESDDVTTVDISSEYMYGIGETCLLLDPFDNYRIFNLYMDYTTKNPLNLSDGQTLYIVFRYGNKEIRISEYTNYGPNISIDKTKGQVLFKITKKQAVDILSMKNRTFYITRVYETYNSTTDSYITSDEEVLFSGYWAERNSEKQSDYLKTIKSLQDQLNQKETALQAMVDSINQLITQNTEYSEQIVNLTAERDSYQKQYEDLCDSVESMGQGILDSILGNTSPGEIIDSQTILLDYSKADEDTKKKLDELTGTSSNISTSSIDDLEDIINS